MLGLLATAALVSSGCCGTKCSGGCTGCGNGTGISTSISNGKGCGCCGCGW